MNIKEEERRARLLKSRAERLPDIKKQFEMAQNRNFNSNFAPGGKDANLLGNAGQTAKNSPKTAKRPIRPKKLPKKLQKKPQRKLLKKHLKKKL